MPTMQTLPLLQAHNSTRSAIENPVCPGKNPLRLNVGRTLCPGNNPLRRYCRLA